jgi:hypothetical protein
MRGREAGVTGVVPGDALLHPLALGAVALLVLNDHLGKALWPGPVSGKLSDLAGLAFFPLLLLGTWEVLLAARGAWHGPSLRPLLGALAATGLAFSLVKTSVPANAAAGWTLGAGQWAAGSLPALVLGHPVPAPAPAALVRDPSDLLALPALLLALAIGLGRLPRPSPWTRRAVGPEPSVSL